MRLRMARRRSLAIIRVAIAQARNLFMRRVGRPLLKTGDSRVAIAQARNLFMRRLFAEVSDDPSDQLQSLKRETSSCDDMLLTSPVYSLMESCNRSSAKPLHATRGDCDPAHIFSGCNRSSAKPLHATAVPRRTIA